MGTGNGWRIAQLGGLSLLTYPHLCPLLKSLTPRAVDCGPFPGRLGKLWKGGGVETFESVPGKERVLWLPPSAAREPSCPQVVSKRLPQCLCQALGIHVPKGFQSGATKHRWHLHPQGCEAWPC